jgi:hypothetical protein
MIHLEGFNSRGKPGEMEELLGRLIPYWRTRGFEVHVYARQYSFGNKEFYLSTWIDSMGDIDGWEKIAQGEEQGQKLMAEMVALATDFEAIVIGELYPPEK